MVERVIQQQARLDAWGETDSVSSVVHISRGENVWHLVFETGLPAWTIYSPAGRYSYGMGFDPDRSARGWPADLRVGDLVRFWDELVEPQYLLRVTSVHPRGISQESRGSWKPNVSLVDESANGYPPSSWYMESSTDSAIVRALKGIKYYGLVDASGHRPVVMYFYADSETLGRMRSDGPAETVRTLIPCLYQPILLRPQEELRSLANASWRIGSFERAFPSLAKIALTLSSCSLDEFEDHLQLLAERDAPTVKLLGLELPSAGIALWGAFLLVGLQFYILVMIEVTAFATRPVPWFSLYAHPVAAWLWNIAIVWTLVAVVVASTRLLMVPSTVMRGAGATLGIVGLLLCGRLLLLMRRRFGSGASQNDSH